MKNRHLRRTVAFLIAACMIFENMLTSFAVSEIGEDDQDCLLACCRDGASVVITGDLPEGAEAYIDSMGPGSDFICEKIGDDAVYAGYEIGILVDGEEYKPKKKVNVSLNVPGITDGDGSVKLLRIVRKQKKVNHFVAAPELTPSEAATGSEVVCTASEVYIPEEDFIEELSTENVPAVKKDESVQFETNRLSEFVVYTKEMPYEAEAEESVFLTPSDAPEFATPSEVEILTPSEVPAPATPSEAKKKKAYTDIVDGIIITVTADDGVFPDDAELCVEKIDVNNDEALETELEEAVSGKRTDGTRKSGSLCFDITMLVDGEEVQPDNEKGDVYVTFTMEDSLNSIDRADIYHIRKEAAGEDTALAAEKLEVLTGEETENLLESVEEAGMLNLTAQTDGFSYYIVEFSYEPLNYKAEMLADDEENSISVFDIMWGLGFNDECDDTYKVELLEVIEGLTLEEGDSLKNTYIRIGGEFAGTGTLKLTTTDAAIDPAREYEIEITCEVPVQKYDMSYRPGADNVTGLPETDKELTGGEPYMVSSQVPVRAGYRFIDWTLYWEEYYTVYYLEEGTNLILADAKTVPGVKAEQEVTEDYLPIENYALIGEEQQSITIESDADNIIKFYYRKQITGYTVRYLEEGTDYELESPKTVNGRRIGREITENAITIENYDLVSADTETITLARNEADNVITFYYKRIPTYQVTYVVIEDPTYGVPEDSKVPTDLNQYHSGDPVEVADQLTTEQGYANKDGEKIPGTWTFTPWDKADFEITEDTTITGEWTFTPKTYKVTYVVNPDPTYGIPEGSTVPIDPKEYKPGEQVVVADQLTTTVDYAYNSKGEKISGTWEFTPWDKDDFQIYEDKTITGGWTFKPAPPPVKYHYTVHYILWDDYLKGKITKVADDETRDEIDKLGVTVTEPAKTGNDLKPKYRKNYQPVPGYESVTATIYYDGYEIWIFYQKKSSSS